MFRRILFVCLGNICRSPAAQGVFCQFSQQAGLDLQIDSAGTGDWHIGKAPYGPMQKAALARGYNLSNLRARLFSPNDFTAFDLIIGMDNENIANIERLRPTNDKTPVRLFTDYTKQSGASYIPDPYFTGDYEGALTLIEQASRGLLDQLQ